jgi:putative phosphoribosyl transferase
VKRFVDRAEAGRLLGVRLSAHGGADNAVVLGLPRGGVVVAYEVARVLGAPLDIVVVRKVGAPSQPELAMGALAEGGVTRREIEICVRLDISDDEFSRAASRERLELDRRVRRYRQRGGILDLVGRTVVVVDDGIATGATALAAVASVRARNAGRIVLAAPVASAEAAGELDRAVDDVVVLVTSPGPFSVGSFYDRFEQTTDREVVGYLTRARRVATTASSAPSQSTARDPSKSRRTHHRRSP